MSAGRTQKVSKTSLPERDERPGRRGRRAKHVRLPYTASGRHAASRFLFFCLYSVGLLAAITVRNTLLNFVILAFSTTLIVCGGKMLLARLLVRLVVQTVGQAVGSQSSNSSREQAMSAGKTAAAADIVRGQAASLPIVVYNRAPVSYAVCRARFSVRRTHFTGTQEEELQEQLFQLRALRTKPVPLQTSFPHCGCYELRLYGMQIWDNFGYSYVQKRPRGAKRSRRKGIAMPVTVFPPIISLHSFDASLQIHDDAQLPTAQIADDRTEETDLRAFTDGDNTRFIHWKKSAGQDNWVVKKFYVCTDRPVCLYLDPCMNAFPAAPAATVGKPAPAEKAANDALRAEVADRLADVATALADYWDRVHVPHEFCYAQAAARTAAGIGVGTATGIGVRTAGFYMGRISSTNGSAGAGTGAYGGAGDASTGGAGASDSHFPEIYRAVAEMTFFETEAGREPQTADMIRAEVPHAAKIYYLTAGLRAEAIRQAFTLCQFGYPVLLISVLPAGADTASHTSYTADGAFVAASYTALYEEAVRKGGERCPDLLQVPLDGDTGRILEQYA